MRKPGGWQPAEPAKPAGRDGTAREPSVQREPSGRALAAATAGLALAALALWGASVLPWPAGAPSWTSGVALLALAGIAGVVATSGILRRAVGVLLAVAGLAALVGSVPGLGAAPLGTVALIVGGLLLVATGGLVAARETWLARFGARYSRTAAAPTDPDRAAWDALDEGRDPTDTLRDGLLRFVEPADPGSRPRQPESGP